MCWWVKMTDSSTEAGACGYATEKGMALLTMKAEEEEEERALRPLAPVCSRGGLSKGVGCDGACGSVRRRGCSALPRRRRSADRGRLHHPTEAHRGCNDLLKVSRFPLHFPKAPRCTLNSEEGRWSPGTASRQRRGRPFQSREGR